MTSMTDLTAYLADTLFAGDVDRIELEDSIREHRTESYEDSMADEALAQTVWADITGGAEYPF